MPDHPGSAQEKERAAAERGARAREAFEGANDGLWDWDLIQNRIYYSPRWKAMLGYADYEIGNSPSEWMGRVYPEDVEKNKASETVLKY